MEQNINVEEIDQEATILQDIETMESLNDATYENIMKYETGVDNIYYQLNELFGQKVVMTVGVTGVGKSTLMNAII